MKQREAAADVGAARQDASCWFSGGAA